MERLETHPEAETVSSLISTKTENAVLNAVS
jgi:hypothetical protein